MDYIRIGTIDIYNAANDQPVERIDGMCLPMMRHRHYAMVNGVKKDLYQDAETVNMLLQEGILGVMHPASASMGYTFNEYTMAKEDVSPAVLDVVFKYGCERKYLDRKTIEGAMSLVNNPNILEWFLKKGYKCKHISGCGPSTMEFLICGLVEPAGERKARAEKMAELLVKYKAWDKRYVKSFPKGHPIREYFLDKDQKKGSFRLLRSKK